MPASCRTRRSGRCSVSRWARSSAACSMRSTSYERSWRTLMTRADEPLSSRTLGAFLEGEVTRSEAEQIEAKLHDCALSRRRLERIAEIRRSLTELPDELDGVDLVDGVRQAIMAGSAAPVRAARGRWWPSAA